MTTSLSHHTGLTTSGKWAIEVASSGPGSDESGELEVDGKLNAALFFRRLVSSTKWANST